jgi:ABC-type multidrug transport system fused ATPase/permease subunit
LKTYIYKTKKYIIAQILWDLVGVVCLAISPLLQQWLFDYGLESSLTTILQLIVAYFALLFFYTLSQFFCMLFAFKGGIKFEKLLKRDFFSAIFNMEPSQFYNHAIGEYISLQGNDITALEQDYLEPMISIVRCVNMMIVYGIVLFVGVDWRIALVIILSSICAILIPKLMGKALTYSRSVYQEQLAEYVTVITDLLEGFRVINQLTVGKIRDRHENVLNETAEKRYLYGKEKSFVLGISELMTKVVKILTFAVVAILFYKKEITVGTGVATLSYVSSFIEPIDSILYNITTMRSMKDVKQKVLSYIRINPFSILPKKRELHTEMSLENVTFKREKFALKNVNLTIKRGMKYAVVGQSGSGKSTLLKLIMGYEKENSGVIKVDGENLRKYDISELISYTDQNEHIYRVGLEDNITVFGSYNQNGISSIQKNIRSEIFEEIFKRRDEECQCFSGGEKQAVAFLRMVAKNAEIILLDEPFSAMDVKTKSAVEHYLFTGKEFKDKTILVVTHDVSEESLSLYDGVIHVEDTRIYCELPE